MKDQLFVLDAPFEDAGRMWYCNDCATLEGALAANPDWEQKIDVHRTGYARPRQKVVDLLGDENQWLPVLVMDAETAPAEARRVNAFAILTDPKEIARAIVARHGGAGPHP